MQYIAGEQKAGRNIDSLYKKYKKLTNILKTIFLNTTVHYKHKVLKIDYFKEELLLRKSLSKKKYKNKEGCFLTKNSH